MDAAELSSKLLAMGVLGHEQYEHIRSQTTPTETNNELIDVLVRRSCAHFQQFLKALQATGQRHVADVLVSSGGPFTEA